MVYPKPIMSRKEMIKLGIPEALLIKVTLEKGQKIAFRPNPASKTSPWLYDTEEFEKYRVNLARISTQGIPGRMGAGA